MADASKTIDAYYQADGVSVKVLFLNGHSGTTFTINGKTVYANKDGVAVAVPSHTINSVSWFVQAYTTLELIYLSSLDDGNGGWLVVGNPIVLSGTVVDGNNKYDYEVKANGFIEQQILVPSSEWVNDGTKTVTYPITFTLNSFAFVTLFGANITGGPTYRMFGYEKNLSSFTFKYSGIRTEHAIFAEGY